MSETQLKLPKGSGLNNGDYIPPAALNKLPVAERRALIESMRRLRPDQRIFLHALIASSTQAQAHRKMEEAGFELNKSTTSRWMRSPAFMTAWRHLERAYVRNITKDGVIAKTQALMEEAMTPKPILYKGEYTGYDEVEIGTAVRALELQGKAVGAWRDEDQKTIVNIDIDFSGRPPEVELRDAIEGELVNPTPWSPDEDGALSELSSDSEPDTAQSDDWLDG